LTEEFHCCKNPLLLWIHPRLTGHSSSSWECTPP